MSYLALRHLHVGCVVFSGLGFALRALWMLQDSPRLQQRLTRVLPHVVDTLLLASAIGLAVWSGQYPLAVDWLTAKVLGLLAYIVLGALALRRGRTRVVRLSCLPLALGAYAYIVSVALTRSPYPF